MFYNNLFGPHLFVGNSSSASAPSASAPSASAPSASAPSDNSQVGGSSAYDSLGNDINWFQSMFDSVRDEMNYNAQQAQIERDFNAQEAQKSRDFNAQQAQFQRDFEERLSGSAYQRAVSDMRAAGLNPYLVYGSGSAASASTPSGASASGSALGSTSARTSTGNATPLIIAALLNSAASMVKTISNFVGAGGPGVGSIGFG